MNARNPVASGQFGFLRFDGGFSSSHLSLANGSVATSYHNGDSMAMTVFTTPDNSSNELPAFGFVMSRTPSSDLPAYFSFGAMAERQSLLRSAGSGAFGTVASNAVFVGAGASARSDGWLVSAEAELGLFNPKIRSGMIRKISPLTTSAFTLKGTKSPDARNSVTFEMSQRLRVESGKADLTIPAGRTPEGDVLYSDLTADLNPSGREISFAVRWDRALKHGGHFSVESAIVKDPGHVRSSKLNSRIIAA